jgi:hypothetical protein
MEVHLGIIANFCTITDVSKETATRNKKTGTTRQKNQVSMNNQGRVSRYLQISMHESSNVFSGVHPRICAAFCGSAMHTPTSPSLLGDVLVFMGFQDTACIVSTTSLTELPFPVPRLIAWNPCADFAFVAVLIAATCPLARSLTWMKSRTAMPSAVSQSEPKTLSSHVMPSMTRITRGMRLFVARPIFAHGPSSLRRHAQQHSG